MDINELIDMDDDEFEAVVMQAVKRREAFPGWWRAVLHPQVVDETETVIRAAQEVAWDQAKNPERFPQAEGFARKMRGVLAEVKLARIVGAG